MTKLLLGVDIGGTTVKIGFIKEDGTILYKWEIPTNIDHQGTSIATDIWTSIEKKQALLDISEGSLQGIGMGAPGFINEETGFVYEAVNIGWKNFALADEFKKLTNLPIFVANDANIAVLGENWKGAGNQSENLIAVTLGTGVGGGIIANGSIVSGESGTAGEIGHITVDPDGHQCNCGRKGCLETITSATGIVRQAMHLIEENPNSDLAAYYKQTGKITSKDIFDLARKGDKLCDQVIHHTADVLGFVIANTATVINPSKILIGGGVSQAGDAFIQLIEEQFNKYALARISDICEIKIAELGNDAGIIGAASLVKNHVDKQ